MKGSKTRTITRGRNAKNGQFVKIEYANKHPNTTIIDKMKVVEKKK